MASNKVLITGIAGFIGSNLADRLLKEGYIVIGLDNLSYGIDDQVPAGAEFHRVDIRSRDIYPLFAEIDTVFHLAAKNSIVDCQNDPVETAEINVTGTTNIFEAAKRAGVKKVIYAETSALYEGVKTIPTPEREVNPESFYAISKLCDHVIAEGYKRFFGLTVTGLRYFNVYGPRQDYRRTISPVMSAFIVKLLKGERPIIYGDGSKRRDFIHVDDINDFHMRCVADSRTDNKVFNLGSGMNYSILELYRMICGFLRVTIEPEFRPDLPGEAEENLADISAARALGWSPKVDIREGLKGMIEYIREEIKKGNV